jgi:hypothetical protein
MAATSSHLGICLAAVAVCAGLVVPLPADAQEASEAGVKAAFLFNFSKFVEWPPHTFSDPHAPISLCVLGNDPFEGKLGAAVANKSVRGRALSVSVKPSTDEGTGCHIVYLSASEAAHMDELLARFRGKPVLTVGDGPGFVDAGGIIGLKLQDRKVRFEVNMLAAREAQLKLSSQLLKVAVQIIGQME